MLKPDHSELQHTINEKLRIEEAPPNSLFVTQLETLFLLSLSEMRLEKKPPFYSGSTAYSQAGERSLSDSSLKLKPHCVTGAMVSSSTQEWPKMDATTGKSSGKAGGRETQGPEGLVQLSYLKSQV